MSLLGEIFVAILVAGLVNSPLFFAWPNALVIPVVPDKLTVVFVIWSFLDQAEAYIQIQNPFCSAIQRFCIGNSILYFCSCSGNGRLYNFEQAT